jgi:membrane-associated protein
MTHHLAVNVLDARSLLKALGPAALAGVLAIIFAETGLLIGFFLPGDSLLVLAGVAASSAAKAALGVSISLPVLMIGAPICAIAGAQVGYLLGVKLGPRLFAREDSRLFKRKHLEAARRYFDRFGPAKAVVLARFVPVVRTFLNPVAGALDMPAGTFFAWNVVGGLAWTEAIILLGYYVGSSLASSIDKYLVPGIAVIVILSLLPIILELWRSRRGSRRGTSDASQPRDLV